MEFKVSSADLLKGLMDVSKAIPAKSALPILENFLFVAKDGVLEITASDQELTLRTAVKLTELVSDGAMAVPAHQLLDLIKALPDQPVEVRTTSDASFECIWASGNSSLPYFPADDYPDINAAAETDTQSVLFPAQTILDGISGTIYAAADDEMRPAMNGIFFDITPGSVTFVASDSHKLVCYTDSVDTDITASFILHKRPAAVLRGIIGKDADMVECRFGQSSAVFSFGSTTMICRLIVGKYPRYRDVIPQNNANVLHIDRDLLLNTVRRVAVCANKASNHIKLDFAPGQLEITAQDLGFNIAAYEKIECDYNGIAFSIGFKSSFLIEMLQNLNCQALVMKFADGRRPALVQPSEDEPESAKFCGIIMPIMVS